MIVIREKCVKVWTNFGNLVENFRRFCKKILKGFRIIFNKNLEKFNENLKFFLQSILISALKILL